jgi:hypothetical protein
MNRFLAQIGKAARLMDLKGDVKGAVTILESVLDDPEIDQYPAEKVEVIVFIADLHIHIKENKKAAEYLNRLAGMATCSLLAILFVVSIIRKRLKK